MSRQLAKTLRCAIVLAYLMKEPDGHLRETIVYIVVCHLLVYCYIHSYFSYHHQEWLFANQNTDHAGRETWKLTLVLS